MKSADNMFDKHRKHRASLSQKVGFSGANGLELSGSPVPNTKLFWPTPELHCNVGLLCGQTVILLWLLECLLVP